MKNIFTFLTILVLAINVIGQETESYEALFTGETNIPIIDGEIDAVWEAVQMVPLTKVPINDQITEPSPTPDDYSAEFGMVWNMDGLFVFVVVTDDELVIVDDYYADNEIEADMWWTDDNINLLFSKDLYNLSFVQWEFAYQPMVDQEEKLTSDLWANDALIDGSMVETKWFQDGDMYFLETFIKWEAFRDGEVLVDFGDEIYCEVRARDDDDADSWETMFQWSTTNYQVEGTGEGLGSITLSETEISLESISLKPTNTNLSVYPNPSSETAILKFKLGAKSDVTVQVFDVTGKEVLSYEEASYNAGQQTMRMDVNNLKKGQYLVKVISNTNSFHTSLLVN